MAAAAAATKRGASPTEDGRAVKRPRVSAADKPRPHVHAVEPRPAPPGAPGKYILTVVKPTAATATAATATAAATAAAPRTPSTIYVDRCWPRHEMLVYSVLVQQQGNTVTGYAPRYFLGGARHHHDATAAAAELERWCPECRAAAGGVISLQVSRAVEPCCSTSALTERVKGLSELAPIRAQRWIHTNADSLCALRAELRAASLPDTGGHLAYKLAAAGRFKALLFGQGFAERHFPVAERDAKLLRRHIEGDAAMVAALDYYINHFVRPLRYRGVLVQHLPRADAALQWLETNGIVAAPPPLSVGHVEVEPVDEDTHCYRISMAVRRLWPTTLEVAGWPHILDHTATATLDTIAERIPVALARDNRAESAYLLGFIESSAASHYGAHHWLPLIADQRAMIVVPRDCDRPTNGGGIITVELTNLRTITNTKHRFDIVVLCGIEFVCARDVKRLSVLYKNPAFLCIYGGQRMTYAERSTGSRILSQMVTLDGIFACGFSMENSRRLQAVLFSDTDAIVADKLLKLQNWVHTVDKIGAKRLDVGDGTGIHVRLARDTDHIYAETPAGQPRIVLSMEFERRYMQPFNAIRFHMHGRHLIRGGFLGPIFYADAASMNLSGFDVILWTNKETSHGLALARVLDAQATVCIVAKTRNALQRLVGSAMNALYQKNTFT